MDYKQKITTLAAQIVKNASNKGLTIGSCESCTGGLIATSLTDIPGSSDVFRGTVVSYAVAIKQKLLGVSNTVLDTQGVVSEACAQQMAKGGLALLETDICVSTTGIAGPGGAEPGKPVGTVCFAIESKAFVFQTTQHFVGNREEIREQATLYALDLVDQAIQKFVSI